MAESDSNENSDDSSENKKNKLGPGLVLVALLGLIAFASGGAAAYFLTPSKPVETVANADSESSDKITSFAGKNSGDGKKKEKKKKRKSKKEAQEPSLQGGELQVMETAAYLQLDPLIISIEPIGQSRHLRIQAVIETDPEHAILLSERIYQIRDAFNTYLRSTNAKEFEDPAAMSRLRAQLLRRSRAVAPDANIQSVLITEFILT